MLYCDYCTATINPNETSFESEECKQKCRICSKCYHDLRLKHDEKSKLYDKFDSKMLFCCPCCSQHLYVFVEIPAED
jgi:hypothetical protein